ncbi:MAG: DUF2142 domain-containing protein [Candidatus Moranbacteria bacterium]|nr:DUF2142 domain-containing protein [Candidatus Moranbacteria bacterium]
MRLAALLALFAVEGAVLSFLIPMFQNPDEQVHYGTAQHWAEPKEKTWEIHAYESGKYFIDAKDIRTSNLPEEMVQSASIAKFNELTFERQNIQNFSDKSLEKQITENDWKRYVDVSPTATSGTKSVYYLFASWLERFFSDESIFTRIFSMRMLGVAFGAATVLLMYLTVRKIGLSEKTSLLFTTLVAFQPMFAITAAQVNIDVALIFSFSLFLYAGVSFLRSVDSSTRKLARNDKEGDAAKGTGFFATLRMTDGGLGMTKWAIIAIIAAVLGLLSKGPGIVLVAALYPLFVWGAYQRYTRSLDYARDDRKEARNDKVRKFFAYLGITTITLVGFGLLAVPKDYLIGITNATALSKFDSPLESIGKYLDKTMRQGEFRDTLLSYWGNFGWLDTPIPEWILSVINWIEIVGFVAVLMYLLAPVLKKMDWIAAVAVLPRNDKVGRVPERKYLVFFLGMIISLQFAIRFYDWRVFDATGQVLIGQPGRYFLPNLIGHLVLVVVGVGIAVSWVRGIVIPSLSRNLGILRYAQNDKIGTGFFATLRMTDGEKTFEMILKILALAMILLQLYAIVNVIIPRYYL